VIASKYGISYDTAGELKHRRAGPAAARTQAETTRLIRRAAGEHLTLRRKGTGAQRARIDRVLRVLGNAAASGLDLKPAGTAAPARC
jgi:hypothetical protein